MQPSAVESIGQIHGEPASGVDGSLAEGDRAAGGITLLAEEEEEQRHPC